MDDLPEVLTREARRLNLNPLTLERADPEDVLAFASRVLEELAARGLLPGAQQIGCHARPRPAGN
ncbi:hypothetical protein ACFSR9_12890 [Deinococcus taklimakanensis]|uniref:Uncharacterized protein n=1 Tax=Deinococcus taklimakanensis TaxID=536443 RepID=A0ABW5P769_9DEIO